MELLEDRTVMSTLPIPVVGSTAQILTDGTASANLPYNVSPTVAVDPLDPTKIVEVHATFVNNASPKFWELQGNYSNDGEVGPGRRFHSTVASTLASTLTDPGTYLGDGINNRSTPFLQITDPQVAFDRNHRFYVVESQHSDPTAATTSGAIVLQRFDFSGSTPTQAWLGRRMSIPSLELTIPSIP